MSQLKNHLGGHNYKTHTDVGALSFLWHTFKIRSLIDVGCGTGKMVELAKTFDISAIGVDGDFSVHPDIVHDYTEGILKINQYFDMAWSVEFLEHVEERFLPNVFDTFKKCSFIFCTANPVVGNGHHHVNCQPLEYWIDVFAQYRFRYLEKATRKVRKESTMKRDFVRNTGMLYINIGRYDSISVL